MNKVLIADDVGGTSRLKVILNGHSCSSALTMSAAAVLLNAQTFDLVVAGLHFDDSQMFELIKLVKKCPPNRDTPIICFCSRDNKLSRQLHESLEYSTKAMGAWMYIAEHAYNEFQNPEAELRRVMDRCLTEELRKDIQQQRIVIETHRTELQKIRTLLQAQDWTPELQINLNRLQTELDLLLKEIDRLHLAATKESASVLRSRDLMDRVSHDVTITENRMAALELTQFTSEQSQSDEELELTEKESAKRQDQE